MHSLSVWLGEKNFPVFERNALVAVTIKQPRNLADSELCW